MKPFLVILSAIFWSFIGAGCMHLKAAWKRVEINRISEDWGLRNTKKPWIYVPLLFCMLLLSSCSTVSVTRTAGGAVHAGVTSFVGKQTIADATVTTREGDTIRINGYSTQNPDPETTKLVRDGWLGGKVLEGGSEIINNGIDAIQ